MNKLLIILINYNSIKHTIECIESVYKSSFDNYEILVIDNASDDNCREELRNYNKVHVIENKENVGFAMANNIGIDCASKYDVDYVLMLNNDTIVDGKCLERIINYANTHVDVGIVTGKIFYYYDKQRLWYAGGDTADYKGDAVVYGFNEIDSNKYSIERECTFASGCCMLIPIDVARKVKLSNKYFLYFEDTDYCKKIKKIGKNIYFCPDAIIYHKESVSTGKGSKSYSYYIVRNRFIYIKENIKWYKRFVAYIISSIVIFKRCCMGIIDVEGAWGGIVDFILGRSGKCTKNYK